MQPKLTPAEYAELKQLLNIVQDKTKSPGERRIAKAKFERLYNQARKRMASTRSHTVAASL
ncbi:hypothetical protein [Tumebacillus flagellatus]|uniref:Uncharacterized protein n=1 Tax=Tumebacillus flagellatus TaxID=1157490 RepID=A0A074LJ56_9BACL|nr:hypothetical protein [Tumebacillus flagellatus]KEO82216.1 hypothetical protein EL26_16325 [Tumebacillus flagellatus]